jgi:hypothetical protein
MTQEQMDKAIAEIWAMFRENAQEIKQNTLEIRQNAQELRQNTQEIRGNGQEIKEIRQGLQESRAYFDKVSKEHEQDFASLKELFNKTDRQIEKTEKMVQDLTGKWSRFVEGLIAPGAIRLFKERGIHVDTVYQRVKRFSDEEGIEVDVMVVGRDYAVLIEAKSTLQVEDVNDHLERIVKFRRLFPEYKDKKVIGAVGGIVIDEESDKYAYRQGLFVIAESGETVKILNDMEFMPKVW